MDIYTFVFSSIFLLIQFYHDKYKKDDLNKTLVELEHDDNLPRIHVYDFIIVGGGTAGCVVARRLSEHYKVLLLEIGGTPVPATVVPVFQPNVASHPAINYKYTSIPQKYANLQNNGIITQVPGKMLGGSTSHHALVYSRSHPLDYDKWANITKDVSWKYENLLKYFKKSENFIGYGIPEQHGRGGLMTVDTGIIPIVPTWLAAGAELNFDSIIDPNGPQREGFAAVQITRERGRRVSSYTSFIQPIDGKRETLKIERYSEVSKILIDANKSAYGVAYKRHGIPQIAHASKEVIISAGTFASPMLLMKSGIGPAEVLKLAKIPVLADLPVGKGIQEHTAVILFPILVNDTSLFPRLPETLTENSINEYLESGDGTLKFGPVGAQIFMVSSRAKSEGESEWPDVEIDLNDGFKNYPVSNPHALGFGIVLGRPKSKGKMTMNTTAYQLGERSDEKLAIIDYNILSDPSDVDVLVEGIRLVLTVIENTTQFRQLGAIYSGSKHGNCSKFNFRSNEYWKCYVHQVGTTWLHFTTSCSMGSGIEDKDAVLDSKLNVIGIFNLKVVDASVMPSIPNSNTATPVIMIAEKASDEIIKAWKKKAWPQ